MVFPVVVTMAFASGEDAPLWRSCSADRRVVVGAAGNRKPKSSMRRARRRPLGPKLVDLGSKACYLIG